MLLNFPPQLFLCAQSTFLTTITRAKGYGYVGCRVPKPSARQYSPAGAGSHRPDVSWSFKPGLGTLGVPRADTQQPQSIPPPPPPRRCHCRRSIANQRAPKPVAFRGSRPQLALSISIPCATLGAMFDRPSQTRTYGPCTLA